MSGSGNALQKAIYEAVAPVLAGLSVPAATYDAVPKTGSYPYATIGEEVSIPWDTMIELGEEVSFRVHTWSNAPGLKELKGMNKAIYDRLHNGSLTIAGYGLTYCFWEGTDILGDPDDAEVRHGVMNFRAVLSPA